MQANPHIVVPGSVECNGKIICIFLWKKDPNNVNDHELPPSAVILDEYAEASADGDATSVDNGLGSPVQTNGTEKFAIGHKYSIMENPGDQFEVWLAPTAFAAIDDPSPNLLLGAVAGVLYVPTVTPIRVRFAGTIKINDDNLGIQDLDACEVGQGITMWVDAGPYAVTGFDWSNLGDFITGVNWGPGHSTRSVIGVPSPTWWNLPSPAVIYTSPRNQDGGLGNETDQPVQCSVSVTTILGEPVGAGIVSSPLAILGPDAYLECDIGPSSYWPQAYLATEVQANGPYGSPPGATFDDAFCKTNELISNVLGVGEWGCVQIIGLDKWLHFVSPIPIHKVTGWPKLDSDWPYEGFFAADGSKHDASDQPSLDLIASGITASSYNISDHYNMHNAYKPPAHPNGWTNEFISRRNIQWYWALWGHRNFPGDFWYGPYGPGVQADGAVNYEDWIFQWDGVFVAI